MGDSALTVLSAGGVMGTIWTFMMIANNKWSGIRAWELLSWLLPAVLGAVAFALLPLPSLAGQPWWLRAVIGFGAGLAPQGAHAAGKKAKNLAVGVLLLFVFVPMTGCATLEAAGPKVVKAAQVSCEVSRNSCNVILSGCTALPEDPYSEKVVTAAQKSCEVARKSCAVMLVGCAVVPPPEHDEVAETGAGS